MALEDAGWTCVFANDIDEKKAASYRLNFGSAELKVCDIRLVKPHEVPRTALITASFPCVDLSLAGNRAGLSGRESGAFWPFMKLIAGLAKEGRHPWAVILENVIGFLTSRGGDDFKDAISELNRHGYRCDVVVLDAINFVPQSRPRVFVIGIRDDAPSNPMRSLRPLESESGIRPPMLEKIIRVNRGLSWGRIDLPSPESKRVSLSDIIEEIAEDDLNWWSSERVKRLIDSMKPIHQKKIECMRRSNAPAFGTIYRRTREGRAVAEVRNDDVAGCLRTARGGSSKQFLVVGHSGRVRVRNLTPREYARLQGVPDTYRIEGDVNAMLSAFGDAVCVPAVRWLAENALDGLRNRFRVQAAS